jgi:hypothetical protein
MGVRFSHVLDNPHFGTQAAAYGWQKKKKKKKSHGLPVMWNPTRACLHVVQTASSLKCGVTTADQTLVDLKLVGRDSMTTKMGGGSILSFRYLSDVALGG